MGLFRGKVKNYLKQAFLERERGILESFAQGMQGNYLTVLIISV